jgi:hypothetical protein
MAQKIRIFHYLQDFGCDITITWSRLGMGLKQLNLENFEVKKSPRNNTGKRDNEEYGLESIGFTELKIHNKSFLMKSSTY